MITANELRIGNWVNAEGIFEYKVAVILNDSVGLFDPDPHEEDDIFYPPIDEINPIPLTPELLEKCKASYNGIKNDDKVTYHSYTVFGKEIRSMTKQPYLHQLQNLYYNQTGEELTVNL
jgi:hypothetical protein